MASNQLIPQVVITDFTEEKVNSYIEKIDNIIFNLGQNTPILLKIDSFGGSLHSFVNLYEKTKSIANPIVTYTSSKAMSAGAFILTLCASDGFRFASPHSEIMIHEVQITRSGALQDVEYSIKKIREKNRKWLTMVAKRAGMKSYKDIYDLMDTEGSRDIYLTAKKAKSLGFIDDVCYVRLNPVSYWEIMKG